MGYYIRSRIGEGLFVGECLGFAFFEDDRGKDISEEEQPVEFNSREEAEEYLATWSNTEGYEIIEIS